MKKAAQKAELPPFVDMPGGIFTAGGVWFHTRQSTLEEYAAPVLRREPLPRLLEQAEVWLRAPQTLTLWALPLLLVLLSPLPAAGIALALFLGGELFAPALVSRTMVPLFRWLEKVLLQGLYYVTVLSVLAMQGHLVPVGVGFGGFVLLRWGVLQKLTDPLVRRGRAALYDLPAPDQVLRSLILRAALKYGISLPELDRIAQSVHNVLNRK